MTTLTTKAVTMPSTFKEALGSIVPNNFKADFIPIRLKGNFSLIITFESTVYGVANRLSEDYTGGLWDFIETPNLSFFFSLGNDEVLTVLDHNRQCEVTVDGDVFGVIATLTAMSDLSFYFSGIKDYKAIEICSDLYHRLYDVFWDTVDDAIINERGLYTEQEVQDIKEMSEVIGSILD